VSRLIDKLTRLKKTEPQPMGFATRQIVPQKPRLQLIARLSAKDYDRLSAALNTADAALVEVHKADDVEAIDRVCKMEGSGPGGGWLKDPEADLLTKLTDTACDFVVFPPAAPLTAIRKEKMGRLMQIDLDMPDNLLRTINDLPIEGVVVARPEDEESAPINFERLMAVQRLAYLISKPILLEIPSELASEELQAIWDAGASGVIVTVSDKKSADNLSSLIAKLENLVLPSVHKKPRLTAVLPHLQAEPAAPRRVEEEEEEEE
jgi:hypothetical protein